MAHKVPAVVCKKIGAFTEALEWDSIALPPVQNNEIKVRVSGAGLAFPDILTIEGKHFMKKKAPFVPGNEVAGVVVECGADVAGFRVGDRVFGLCSSGALAAEAIMDPSITYKIPLGVSEEQVAGLELNYGTTYHGIVDLANIKKGETLLVLGASGGVGISAVDLGQALGARVVACASSAEKLAHCKRAGADVLINYSSGPKAFKEDLKKAGVYGKIDVVYDPVGGALSEVAMRAMGWRGRFVVIGFASGGATPAKAIPKMPLNLALLNERQIMGCFWGVWKARDKNRGNRANVDRMVDMVRQGQLKPLVCTYPLADYQRAMEDMMARRVVGKIILLPPPQAKL